jgi:steroid delta-isomerase-like uncharacterized protein
MRGRSYTAPIFFAFATISCAVYSKQQPVAGDKAVALAYVQAWNAHDTAAIDTLLASDGVHEDIAQNFRGVGAKAVNEFMRGLISAEPDFKWNVTSSMEDGRLVGIEWTWTGTYTGKDPSGKQVSKRRISGRGASVVEVDDGRIKRFTDYYDDASFFR